VNFSPAPVINILIEDMPVICH